jgi:hypothetical protein
MSCGFLAFNHFCIYIVNLNQLVYNLIIRYGGAIMETSDMIQQLFDLNKPEIIFKLQEKMSDQGGDSHASYCSLR